MSNIFKVAAVLLLNTFFAITCNAGELEAEHNKLRELKTIFENAINKNDLELLRPHIAKGFSFITISDEEYTDFDEFKKQWQIGRETLLKGGTYTLEIIPDLSDIRGNIAITKGDSKNIIITGAGDKYEYPAKWTGVCIQEDGEWKILRAHNSLNPFRNPMVEGEVTKMIIKFSSISALVGIILGWIFCSFINARRKAAK